MVHGWKCGVSPKVYSLFSSQWPTSCAWRSVKTPTEQAKLSAQVDPLKSEDHNHKTLDDMCGLTTKISKVYMLSIDNPNG